MRNVPGHIIDWAEGIGKSCQAIMVVLVANYIKLCTSTSFKSPLPTISI